MQIMHYIQMQHLTELNDKILKQLPVHDTEYAHFSQTWDEKNILKEKTGRRTVRDTNPLISTTGDQSATWTGLAVYLR